MGVPPGSGYGDAACEYAAALDHLGLAVDWTPVTFDGAQALSAGKPPKYMPLAIQQQLSQLYYQHLNCDRLLLQLPPGKGHDYWLQQLPDLTPFCYVAWEVDRLPDDWAPGLNRFDKVLVPSQFNRDTLAEGGITVPIEIVPHISRAPSPAAVVPELGKINDEDFVFYTIGAWTTRKAMEQTLRAYLDAFTAADPVALVIKTEALDHMAYENYSAEQRAKLPVQHGMVWWRIAQIIAAYPRPPKLHLITEALAPGQIDGLHQRGDCYLSLSHAEGWGLGAFDAARLGKPVIMTGWGGQLDYLGKDYPLLVDYALQSTDQYVDDGYFMHSADAHWAHANSEHAVELMRAIYNNLGTNHHQAAVVAKRIAEQFAPNVVGTQLAQALGLKY